MKSWGFISLESGPSSEHCMKQSTLARFHGWVPPTSSFSSSIIRKGNTYINHQPPANINKTILTSVKLLKNHDSDKPEILFYQQFPFYA